MPDFEYGEPLGPAMARELRDDRFAKEWDRLVEGLIDWVNGCLVGEPTDRLDRPIWKVDLCKSSLDAGRPIPIDAAVADTVAKKFRAAGWIVKGLPVTTLVFSEPEKTTVSQGPYR